MKLALLLASIGILGCASTEAPGDSGIDPSSDAATDAGLSGRRIFVTASVQNANFGGLDGADAICDSQAAASDLGGEFQAWLSTMTSSVSDRLTHSSEPYILVDGTLVANDWDDLVDGSILAPINLDASGQVRGGDVWTGTLPSGLPYTQGDCGGFTNGIDGIGLCGTTASTGPSWTANATPECSLALRLYCIEK